METKPSPNSGENIDRREAARKAPEKEIKPGTLAHKIQEMLQKIEDNRDLFEKHAKKMDRVKKIYDRLKNIEEIFNGLLLSVSEEKAENRADVLHKLGVSERLIKEVSYIDANHQYLDLKKTVPKQLGDKFECKPNDGNLTVEIAYKGKKTFAALRSDAHGKMTIMYKDSKGEWQEFATITNLMGLKSKLLKLEKNQDLLNKAEAQVRKLRSDLGSDYQVKLDASDIKNGQVSILFFKKDAPDKKFATIYWKPDSKSFDVYVADGQEKWHNVGSISDIGKLKDKLAVSGKNHELIQKGAEAVRKLNGLLGPNYKAELNASNISKDGEISIWLNTKDKPNANFATIWWKPGTSKLTFYEWNGNSFVESKPHPKTLGDVKARLDKLVKKISESPAALKEKTEQVGRQEGIAKALIHLAKNEDVPAKLQGALKSYLATVQPNKFKTFEVVINRTLVRVAVARSKDGKYFKAFLDSSLTAEGEPSTVLGTSHTDTPIESVAMQLRPDGKLVEAGDKPGSFPDVPPAFASEDEAATEKVTPRIIKAAEALMDRSSYNQPSKEGLAALKSYLKGLKNSEYKVIQITVEGTPVKFQIGRSESGKYYSVNIEFQGKKPKRLRFGGVTILDANGDLPSKTPTGEKFPGHLAAKAGVEAQPNTPEGKLALLFNKIEQGGIGILKDKFTEFKSLIDKMGLSFQKDKINKLKVGGYTIAYCQWSEDAGVKPSIVVFKGEGPQVVCYKAGEYDSKESKPSSWQVSRMLPSYENTTWTRRFAERMAANNALDQVLSKIKGKEFAFTSPQDQLMFEAALHKLSIYSGKSWKAAYEGGNEVHFNKNTGYFKVILPQGRSFYYHVGAPGTFIRPGTSVRCAFPVYSSRQANGLSRLKKRMSEDTERTQKQAEIKRQQEEAARKKAEEARQKAEAAKRKAQLEHNDKQAVRDTVVDKQKYGKYIKNSKDPLVFSVDFGDAKNEKGEKLIDTVKINQLLNVEEAKKQSKVLLVTITDAKGKKQYGMYYPGQKTVYELEKEGGKQAPSSLKFSNKDTFKIVLRNPTEKDFEARTWVDKAVLSPDGLEQEKNIKVRSELIKEFSKLKGKVENLDLTKLAGFIKFKPYNPRLILETDKRTNMEQQIIQKHGLKTLNQILKAEIAVLEKGIKKVKSQPTQTQTGAPSATRRPGRRPGGGAETEKPSPELLSQINGLSEGDGITFIKDGAKMAVFKDTNGGLHYISDLNSGDSSGPKSAGDFKDLAIDTTKPLKKINGAPLLAAVKEISPLGSKKGKTLVFSLENGKTVRVKMKDFSVWGRWANFNYSIDGAHQGVLHTKNTNSQVQAFVKISVKMKPNTDFKYE